MTDFEKFMSQLQETNQTLDFFCDFDNMLGAGGNAQSATLADIFVKSNFCHFALLKYQSFFFRERAETLRSSFARLFLPQ